MASVDRNGVFRSRAYNINYQIYWSTGRELNPRILILQTSALATSPPVLILRPTASGQVCLCSPLVCETEILMQ